MADKVKLLLSQEQYRNSRGYAIDATEIESIGLYKYVIDGFYKWQCGNCGHGALDRECGWPIFGLVLMCTKCKKMNLLLRTDVDWVHKKMEEGDS